MRIKTSKQTTFFSFVLIVLYVGCTNSRDAIPNAVQDFTTSVADFFCICKDEIVVDL